MNNHSLDDLIIGEPTSSQKKSKNTTAIIALIVVIILVGISLLKVTSSTNSTNQAVLDENTTKLVKPDLVPLDLNTEQQKSNLLTVKDRIPTTSDIVIEKTLKVDQTEKNATVIERKKPIATFAVKQVKVSVKKSSTKNIKKHTKKQSGPARLFAKDNPQYFVQVGAFNVDPNPKFLKKIESNGFKYIIKFNGKTQKVRIGPYASRTQAKKALAKIKSAIGIMGLVVKRIK